MRSALLWLLPACLGESVSVVEPVHPQIYGPDTTTLTLGEKTHLTTSWSAECVTHSALDPLAASKAPPPHPSDCRSRRYHATLRCDQSCVIHVDGRDELDHIELDTADILYFVITPIKSTTVHVELHAGTEVLTRDYTFTVRSTPLGSATDPRCRQLDSQGARRVLGEVRHESSKEPNPPASPPSWRRKRDRAAA